VLSFRELFDDGHVGFRDSQHPPYPPNCWRLFSGRGSTGPRPFFNILGNHFNNLTISYLGGVCSQKGGPMAVGDNYRAKTLELLARAETENDSSMRAEFENLAAAYLRLAEQAERNSGLIIDFELPEDGDPKLKR
jgi:hypothetical protein